MATHTGGADVGIITARCADSQNPDYGRNAWAGVRAKPAAGAVLGLKGDFKHVKELIWGTTDDEPVQSDAVGATSLYIRSSLVYQGLSFPDSYAIGTTWSETGWDGLRVRDSYRARGLGAEDVGFS